MKTELCENLFMPALEEILPTFCHSNWEMSTCWKILTRDPKYWQQLSKWEFFKSHVVFVTWEFCDCICHCISSHIFLQQSQKCTSIVCISSRKKQQHKKIQHAGTSSITKIFLLKNIILLHPVDKGIKLKERALRILQS